MKRRDFMKSMAVTSVLAGTTGWSGISLAANAAPLKVGFIYVGPVSDFGWTYRHDQGRKYMIEQLGKDKVETTYVENVPETADAQRILHELAAKGNKLIFSTSFGFMEPTMRVARQFPDTAFEMCTGYKDAPNVGNYTPRWIQARYLTGLIGGKMTKSNIIGYVAPYPIPEVIRGINAFTVGLREVNPEAIVKVIFLNAWFNPGKEQQAAETLISQGADVLNKHTDSPAVIKVAEKKGVYSFGYDSDMSRFGPDSVLTSIIMDWGPFYVNTAKQVINGTWKPEDVWYGFNEGMLKLAPLNPVIPEETANLVHKRKKALEDGSFKVFKGPLTKQNGDPALAKGETLNRHQILNMGYFIKGVKGHIPG